MRLLNLIILALVCNSCGFFKMPGTTEDMKETTEKMLVQTEDMSKTTKDMSGTTEEMSETTKDMKSTTEEMRDITKGMSETTEGMSSTTDNLLDLSRSGQTRANRLEEFEVLKKDTSFENKTIAAGAYHQAFAYQAWTNEGFDTIEKREVMLESATKEYMRGLYDFYEQKKFSKISPSSNKSVDRAVNALAVTMHYTFEKQDEVLKSDPALKKYTMLSIFKSAITKELDGEVLTSYEANIIEHYEIAVEFLNVRYNMLLAMGLSKAGKLKTQNKLSKWIKTLRAWDHSFDTLKSAQKEATNKYLKGAVKTRSFLEKLDIEVNKVENVHKLLSNLRTKDFVVKDGQSRSVDEEEIVFNNYINELK